jgi:tripartite-type tricarboxylate transporter receptor subunit TctC
VRLIVGFPAGASNDIYTRLLAEWLGKQFGRSFIVENRVGAAGNIGLESVVRAAADGYTLGVCGSTEMRGEILYSDLKFSFRRDTTPVATIHLSPNALVVNPSLPVRSVAELIAGARANPDGMTVASPGVGSTQHVFWELFSSMTGARMLHVPYRGGPQIFPDLIGGRVHLYFATMAEAMEYIKAGTLRALAVTSASRIPPLPDVPTVGEFVAGYEAIGWLGVVAPKETPAAIVDTLNKAINAGLADPTLKQTIANLGGTAFASSPAEFGQFISVEYDKWAKVIRAAGIKAE